jgi:hypothetical protein
VRLLLRYGAKVDRITAAGHSALRIATESWRHDSIMPLLENGADFREEFRDGGLIHYAASHRDRTLIKSLLQMGETIDRAAVVDGTTPLMAAVRGGDDSAVRAILEFGPDTDLQDKAGWTALMHAIALDKRTVAELLLAEDADVTLTTQEGINAQLLAGRRGFSELQSLLRQKGAKDEEVSLPVEAEKFQALPPVQRLALAMAAFELYLHGEEIDSLPGRGTEITRIHAQSLLRGTYRVGQAEALQARIHFYFEKGERAELGEGDEVARMSETEFRAKLQTLLDDPVKINALKAARTLATDDGEVGPLAWDLCHHNALLVLGARAGWITEQEAWTQLSSAAKILGGKCNDWDIVASVLRGKLVGTFREPTRAEAMLRLFRDKTDVHNPWVMAPLGVAVE